MALGERSARRRSRARIPEGAAPEETGLVRFGAREYDAEVGRWMSRDPTGFRDDPNLYSYSVWDPVNSERFIADERVSVAGHARA